MTAMIHSFHKLETSIQSRIAGIAAAHPCAASLLTMFGLPLICLLTVFAVTAAAILPFALIFGWL